jgi:hypothetical protein
LELGVLTSYSENETGVFVHSGKCEDKYRTLVTVYAFVAVTVHNNGFLRTVYACCLECNRFFTIGALELIFSFKISKCFVYRALIYSDSLGFVSLRNILYCAIMSLEQLRGMLNLEEQQYLTLSTIKSLL